MSFPRKTPDSGSILSCRNIRRAIPVQIQKLIENNGVVLNGNAVKKNSRPKAGDSIAIDWTKAMISASRPWPPRYPPGNYL